MENPDQFILDYYKKQAELSGDSWSSTMQDETIRNKEIEVISTAIGNLLIKRSKILDLGCGNGYSVGQISERYLGMHDFFAVDFCDDLLNIAKSRKLSNVELSKGDARKLSFGDDLFDLVYTERCLINILSEEGQNSALSEIARILRPGGYYVMIECFLDGHENYNKARREVGLEEIPLPPPNRFFSKEVMYIMAKNRMSAIILPKSMELDANFLSTHYFVARVLHPLLYTGPTIRNSELVKFLSATLPVYGNYSPIQVFIFQKE